jgi:zinc protease
MRIRTIVGIASLGLALMMPPAWARAESGGGAPSAVTVRTLANGLTVAVLEDHRLPIVQIQLLLPAGLAQESPEQSGIANLTAQMLAAGTASRDAQSFSDAVQELGGTLGSSVARDNTTLNGAFLASDFEAGLELMADAALHPRFGEEQFASVRNQVASALDRARRDPRAIAEDQLWAAVFGQHPFRALDDGARSIRWPR